MAVIIFLLLIVVLRLGREYRSYQNFVSQPLFYTHATILNTYPKERSGKRYAVLKLHTEQDRILYTTTWRDDLQRGERLYLQLLPSPQIGFWDYIGGMYCKSRVKYADPPLPSLRTHLEHRIARQHTDQILSSFYSGIFLATPIPKTLREPITRLGVSHLVALSGFHLGILWGVLYGLLLLPYRILQQRFFPYRFALRDVGMVVMAILGYYVWLTGLPPSLVRSYAMLLVGWGMVLMGIDLVSFTFLASIGAVLLALFPSLIVSLGFWLSMAGVFFIFLVLLYCHKANKWVVSLLCIPLGIFVLMQPLVHGIFETTTPWQLLSPALSLGFILFYPLSFVLHLIGQGGALDGMLSWLFALPKGSSQHLLPPGAVAGYIGLAMTAIRWRWAWYLLLAIAGGYVVYLFTV